MIDIVCFKGSQFALGFSKVYNKDEFTIVLGSDNNRKIVENKDIDILLSPERTRKADNLHYRNSGLNQVMCKIAKKNNIAIGISFNDVLKSKNRPLLLGKIMQNIKLCRKYKVKMVFASFATDKYEMRHSKDMLSFCRTLGMTGSEAKQALNYR